MNSPKIINHCGTAVDISRVRSMQVVQEGSSKYHLVFELNVRTGYIFNPGKNVWEKEIFHDVIKIKYEDYEMAALYMAEWAEIWREYSENLDQPWIR